MSSLDPGANKANVIKGQVQDKNLQTFNFVISIRDGLAVFKCESAKYTRKLYKAEKESYGDEITLYDDGTPNKCIIQKYPGRKAGDISKELLTKLRKQKVNITKK